MKSVVHQIVTEKLQQNYIVQCTTNAINETENRKEFYRSMSHYLNVNIVGIMHGDFEKVCAHHVQHET